MDAHVFRRVCDALNGILNGAGLEKIQSPASGVYFFFFYSQIKGSFQLVLRVERKAPFIFIADERHTAGKAPPAEVMRLRKYLRGRRVASCIVDWPARSLYLLFHRSSFELDAPSQIWLELNLSSGPKLILNQCPDIPSEPVWPEPGLIKDICETPEAFRDWPVLTPALRRVLPFLDHRDQAALMADLSYGGGDLYVYEPARPGEDIVVSAWPLPEPLRKGRSEKIFEEPLKALSSVGMRQVMGDMAAAERKKNLAPLLKAKARLERALHKIDEEELRLKKMIAGKESAILLRNNLWNLEAGRKLSEVCALTPGGTERIVKLNSKLTVLENMEFMFHQAKRGLRGLSFIRQRRDKVEAEIKSCGLGEEAGAPFVPKSGAEASASLAPLAAYPKGIVVFKSADGNFALWRGKDARGNMALLKAAAPHDIWMHVEGGPGAHVIIRRSHAGQEIPEAVWREAGLLAAEKSWRKDDAKASLMCAMARHVRPIKGAAPGTVRVDKIFRMLEVEIPHLAPGATE